MEAYQKRERKFYLASTITFIKAKPLGEAEEI
jgi:hypothetical protein